jgi:ABC-2 type transport system permease protein
MTAAAPAARARRGHRIAALARAEGVLLRRSRIVLLTAVALPAALAGAVRALPGAAPAVRAGSGFLIAITTFALLYPVYYNLVVTLAGRREQLVLKRLRAGEATDGEILAGTAAPAVAVAWAQVALAAAVAVTAAGLVLPARAVLAVTGLVLGTAAFALLAIVTSAVTRSAEMAQVTTLPALVVSIAGSGLLVPLAAAPDAVRAVAQALPLTAVTELLRLGLDQGGTQPGLAGGLGAAAGPVLVLAAWIAAGGWAARRWFRWEPRR